ncbi:MAG: acetylornithine deacetylase [Gammaproteobacteria bacterium]|nr:acetylornithine deacetylase [Gammaproteobacteria bacterium]
MSTQTTLDLLKTLIGFDTTSRNSNIELIRFIQALLAEHGIESMLLPDATGHKANLLATIGPTDKPGVMLSGHTDVVPVDGQDWTKPAFSMTVENNRAYGRGTADMKGFVASALYIAIQASKETLETPLHLAFSFDEEVGCLGVHSLLEQLRSASVTPLMCIVGEPTGLKIANGHKGKVALTAKCVGSAGHSALAPQSLNAIHLACDFIQMLRKQQEIIRQTHAQDCDYSVPYTTVHVGKISGGIALNIVPEHCTLEFEIRNIAQDSVQHCLDEISAQADLLVQEHRQTHPEAEIQISQNFAYPGLLTPAHAPVVEFVKSLTRQNDTIKVAFGTEAGLFDEQVGIPSVVCGPGSMAQGHKADEYIEIEQLNQCDAMMQKLLQHLVDGITLN